MSVRAALLISTLQFTSVESERSYPLHDVLHQVLAREAIPRQHKQELRVEQLQAGARPDDGVLRVVRVQHDVVGAAAEARHALEVHTQLGLTGPADRLRYAADVAPVAAEDLDAAVVDADAAIACVGVHRLDALAAHLEDGEVLGVLVPLAQVELWLEVVHDRRPRTAAEERHLAGHGDDQQQQHQRSARPHGGV